MKLFIKQELEGRRLQDGLDDTPPRIQRKFLGGSMAEPIDGFQSSHQNSTHTSSLVSFPDSTECKWNWEYV